MCLLFAYVLYHQKLMLILRIRRSGHYWSQSGVGRYRQIKRHWAVDNLYGGREHSVLPLFIPAPYCKSQQCVRPANTLQHWPLLGLCGLIFLFLQRPNNKNGFECFSYWISPCLCLFTSFQSTLTSLSLSSLFTFRSPLRTAPSPGTLTGHFQLTTTSKTLEEMDKTPSIRSARWDT